MRKERILVVDDENQIVRALERFLTEKGYEVVPAESFDGGLSALQRENLDAALIDLKLGDQSGIELIRKIKKNQPEIVCMIVTGYATIDSAIEAVRAGAYHYLTKPFRLEDVENLLKQALESRKVKQENRLLKQQVSSRFGMKNLIGVSEPMKEVYSLIDKVADTDSTVLILGESGTGKELVARAIHTRSRRSERPLIAVNCGAIPEELLESELFGHVKGAFTGAVATRPGRFEMADGGTIFLDEIGDMSPKLQVKILRVLQERKFEPVGSSRTVESDVRIITATNKNLEKAVKERQFREDLYYRLHVIPIHLPPLRERKSDVALLADYFLTQFSKENGCAKPRLTDGALDAFLRYSWPGNVRELENVIERLVILKKDGEITAEDLPLCMAANNSHIVTEVHIPEDGLDFKNVVNDFENKLIVKALEKTGWNKNRAASLLKLNRTTLVEKIKKRQLIDPLLDDDLEG
ncbi:MAG: sigma-54 dependent transcriptional regulator [bacterium]